MNRPLATALWTCSKASLTSCTSADHMQQFTWAHSFCPIFSSLPASYTYNTTQLSPTEYSSQNIKLLEVSPTFGLASPCCWQREHCLSSMKDWEFTFCRSVVHGHKLTKDTNKMKAWAIKIKTQCAYLEILSESFLGSALWAIVHNCVHCWGELQLQEAYHYETKGAKLTFTKKFTNRKTGNTCSRVVLNQGTSTNFQGGLKKT